MNIDDLKIPEIEHGKTGFVALLGRPNTGKSTLLNNLLQYHLAAVSSKPQTTQKKMLAIYNDEESQIIFLDTPGIHEARLALNEAMMNAAEKSIEEAELLLCMIDPTREPGEEDKLSAELCAKSKKETLLLLNKSDISTKKQRKESLNFFREFLPEAKAIEITAIDAEDAKKLLKKIKKYLPNGPFLFDREELSDSSEREIAAELIREVLLEELKQEIPHSLAVRVESWQEEEKRIKIDAQIILEREAHKGIIIGARGTMIKKITRNAEIKLAELCQKRIKLKVFLKIIPNWRKNKEFLKELDFL